MRKKTFKVSLLLAIMLVITVGFTCGARSPKPVLLESGRTFSDSNRIVSTGRDVFVAQGDVAETVVVIAANARIDGRVRGEVVAIGGTIHVGPEGVIEGTAVAIGGGLKMEPGAQVYGEQVNLGIFRNSLPFVGKVFPLTLGFAWWRAMAGIFLAMLIYWLFPKPVERVAKTIKQDPFKVTLFGLLGYLALVPSIILLIITILGIPLVPVLLLLFLVGRMLGKVALGLLLGQYLDGQFNWKWQEALLVLTGLGLLALAGLIPFAGKFVSFFCGMVSIGAVLWSRMGTQVPILEGGKEDEE